AGESEPARPAAGLRHHLEFAVAADADLTVAAIVDPQRLAPQPRRVRPRQPAHDGLAGLAREHDTPAVDRERGIAGAVAPDRVGRCREERLAHGRAGGDRVQLQVVAVELRAAATLD